MISITQYMPDYNIITRDILAMAHEFGALEANVAQITIDPQIQTNYREWLLRNFHGDMEYLAKNTHLRFNPQLLLPKTLSIICVKIPYLTKPIKSHITRLAKQNSAYVSSYALGRDYHKVIKSKLKKYAAAITEYLLQYELDLDYRVFTDSAPILEIELAQNAQLGWRGKNTLLLHKQQGSMFFLGEIFTNLPLIPAQLNKSPSATKNTSANNQGSCGSCTKCLDVCPTKAFVSPYILDANRCISYLTIEHHGSIPIEFRHAIGNRIYGCDDCQLFCPWNKFSRLTTFEDFQPRHNLDDLSLIDAFNLDEETWQQIMQGSPIHRIGYDRWIRNVAVALGNATTTPDVIQTLRTKINYPDLVVREHIIWALERHTIKHQQNGVVTY